MQNKHLFILGHPASGSTLLMKLLSTSNNVSSFPIEGQQLPIVKDILFNDSRWDAKQQFNWAEVKSIWNKTWDLSKPILLEKSPPNLLRIDQLNQNFENAYFIILVRNPYAYVEGAKRRRNKKTPVDILTKRWVYFTSFQKLNIKSNLKILQLSYEELTNSTLNTIRKVQNFMPEIGNVNFEKEFTVFDNKSVIRNKNEEQIAQLNYFHHLSINSVLKQHKDLLDFFNYDLIDLSEREKNFRAYLGLKVEEIRYFFETKNTIDKYIKKWEKENFFPFIK